MRITDSKIALQPPSENGGRLQLRQPNGNDITLPWQPPGGQAVVKNVQQPMQSDQSASDGVYQYNKMRRDPYAQNNGASATGAASASGATDTGNTSGETGQNASSGIPSEWTKPAKPGAYGNKYDSGFGYPYPNGTGQRPNSEWTKPEKPGAYGNDYDAGFGYPYPSGGNAQGKPAHGSTADPSGSSGMNPPDSSFDDIYNSGKQNWLDKMFHGREEDKKGTDGTGSSTDTGSTGTSTGSKTLMEMYDDYLNKLGDYTTPSAKDQSDLVREMYEANLAANKSQLESDYNQNLSDLESEASKIGSTYYEQQRQAQAESDRNRQSFQEYANAGGLNSGTGGQAELARQNQLSSNLNTLRQSEAEKRAEVERQRVLLGQQYQNAIQKAQAENDLAKAKALYEEAVRVDESLASAAKADADRALQIFNILNNTALSAANAYASQDNLGLYEKLLGISGIGGSSTKELESMYNKAQQISSSGGYYVSNGSGGTTFKKASSDEIEWAQYYIDIINSAGGIDNVQDYLATNYKKYGIPYQTVSRTTASMAEKAKGYSTNKYTIGSEKGKDIANSLGVGNTYQASDGSVWRKSSNGKIYVTKDGVEMEAQIT